MGWEDWTSIDAGLYSNSWVDFDNAGYELPAYRKHSDGMVQLRGGIKSGTMSTVAVTLPTGYRPPNDLIFPTDSNNAFGNFYMQADGDIVPVTGSNTWIMLNFQFDSTGGS